MAMKKRKTKKFKYISLSILMANHSEDLTKGLSVSTGITILF